MTPEDLSEVTEIDREAFPTQWPPADYQYDLKNRLAHYTVACDPAVAMTPLRPAERGGWLRKLLGRPAPEPPPAEPRHLIVGFVGFWVMAGEAHITSIAVRTKYRRRGIGELLLIASVEQAMAYNADVVTLEVRASNKGAQALYIKYGFNEVGVRKGYYLDRGPSGDTREDALIMTTPDIKSASYQAQFRRLKQAHTERWTPAWAKMAVP
jgi:ribosomal-protein-alanine N-acetyltransferase